MPRRANIFLLLAMAVGVACGRFGLPLLIEEADELEAEDVAVVHKRQEAEAQLTEWLREGRFADRQATALLAIVGDRVAPEKDVRGTVLAISRNRQIVMIDDAASRQIVVIDLGSDSGVSDGLELEVQRGGPVPFMLGKVTVAKVWSDRAVAWVTEPCPPIRPGDEVRAAAGSADALNQRLRAIIVRRRIASVEAEYEAALKALKEAMPEIEAEKP